MQPSAGRSAPRPRRSGGSYAGATSMKGSRRLPRGCAAGPLEGPQKSAFRREPLRGRVGLMRHLPPNARRTRCSCSPSAAFARAQACVCVRARDLVPFAAAEGPKKSQVLDQQHRCCIHQNRLCSAVVCGIAHPRCIASGSVLRFRVRTLGQEELHGTEGKAGGICRTRSCAGLIDEV